MMKGNSPKVLMAKPGLDGHWRGIIVVSMALRDAGLEVVYGGNMTAAEIAEAAIQEDVDVVGLSILAPGHMRLISETLEALRQRGVNDIPVIVGGAIPEEDVEPLKQAGVLEIFRPGTDLAEIVTFFRESVPKLSPHHRPLAENRDS